MKKHAEIFIAKMLGVLVLVGVNDCAIAGQRITTLHITDDQLTRSARIAKSTGTDITIVKETTTVNIYGRGKKTNGRIKNTVNKLLKSKKSKSRKSTVPPLVLPSATSAPPRLDRTPALDRPTIINRPPALDRPSAPALDKPLLLESPATPNRPPLLEDTPKELRPPVLENKNSGEIKVY